MLSNVTCRQLASDSEKKAARAIVDKKYREEGYIHGEKSESSGISAYITEGNSMVLGVLADDVMYGTLAFVFDGEAGLPMDSIYKEEVDVLRKKGFTIGEVVQFAVDKDIAREYLSSLEIPVASVPLFGYLLAYARDTKFDYLCISVNPKHVSFYSLLGFEKIGELKHYASVDAPAVAMAFSLKAIESDNFGRNSITKMIQNFFSLYTAQDKNI